jgi:hypothetical protein
VGQAFSLPYLTLRDREHGGLLVHHLDEWGKGIR